MFCGFNLLSLLVNKASFCAFLLNGSKGDKYGFPHDLWLTNDARRIITPNNTPIKPNNDANMIKIICHILIEFISSIGRLPEIKREHFNFGAPFYQVLRKHINSNIL